MYLTNHLSKSYATVLTFSLHLLPGVTLRTNKLRQRFPIKVMILVLIMAITALVEFSTARRL